ncbi:MAG TPA: M20/M25/M40 family metallo-hydrolase [Pyrinomonadaceae bacterium]|nr:M20/M25/M40 family metallo-hydrolase [Pyrinomonadaceae bacterium]
MYRVIVLVIFAAMLTPAGAIGQQAAVAGDAIAKIREEGLSKERSQAMKTIRYLTDVIGPRLTNSPNQRRANQWTKEQLEKWGLKNAAVDPWGEFGRGWELKRFSSTYSTATETQPFRSYPKAWSASTNGPITGDVVFVDASDEAGLEKFKGKLKGAIVFTANERPVQDVFKPTATRNTDAELAEMENAKAAEPLPQTPPTAEQKAAQLFNQRKNRFYFEEGAAVLVDTSFIVDGGTIRVMGASLPPAAAGAAPVPGLRVASKNAPATIPQLSAELEQYNRILRLVKQGTPVKITVDLDARFYDDDLQGYNTIAEIPGTDLKDQVVMVGAHLDSWHSGTGATDNAAGSTVAMEAMRIIMASGLKPRRTIRIGLWTGEEQGLLGSRGYVAKNFGVVGDGSDAQTFGALAGQKFPINKKPAHEKFSAYYNLDNGTGQIRGINLQGNEALRPIFKEWLAPFKDLSATTVSINSVGGTDHLAFDAVGLPGFQFIQDQVEYFSRTWHSTQDVSDRILEEDLKRSAVIMAVFAYNTAMRDELLPRKNGAVAALASVIPQFNFRNELEEADFRRSGMAYQICGGELHHSDLPGGFPSFLAIAKLHDAHAE